LYKPNPKFKPWSLCANFDNHDLTGFYKTSDSKRDIY
jgi:hypothetical protein